MEFRLLAVGDVVTEGGLDCLRRYLRPLLEEGSALAGRA